MTEIPRETVTPEQHAKFKRLGADYGAEAERYAVQRIGDELRQTATVSLGTFVCVSLQGAARGVLFDASASAAGAFQSAGVNAHVA